MFKKKAVIEYAIAFDNRFIPFVPARNAVPQWYKDTPPWDQTMERWQFPNTYKQCLPFYDAMTMGYMIYLPCDIWVHNNGEFKEFTWNPQTYDVVLPQFNSSSREVPRNPEYSLQSTAWKVPLSLKVSDGFSYLITHPMNRFDLPFITMSGILDSNYALPSFANLTFTIRKDFEGLIPQGTPIAQVIPYRNEDWTSVQNQDLLEEAEKNRRATSSLFRGWYKKNIWKRKNYN